MAHSHYVMDLYYPAEGKSDALRRDVVRIPANTDEEAIEEATRIDSWRQPVRYEVRAMTKGARTGHRLVHASVAREPEASEEAAGDDQPVITPSGAAS